ncbi:DUF6221 family protein [Amycolatopsis roodepoortensis]|uniref:DUF6221 family protein n=1 Tax=Amycolatopsis roodepoortensis TaxID=700274 RepID=UPI00214B1C9A|nr:DUF6221 family protein [Amycolatopsis roodepoortensis]UUV34395.1 DUF6221 family protein [Amycolatopsis roodepoortensis]
MTMLDDLITFLRERLLTRKAIAVQARDALDRWESGNDPEQRWSLDGSVIGVNLKGEYCCLGEEVSRFIGLRPPEQEIAEADALLQIVELAKAANGLEDVIEAEFSYGRDGENDPLVGDSILKQLALPYADHPEYREEWRP